MRWTGRGYCPRMPARSPFDTTSSTPDSLGTRAVTLVVRAATVVVGGVLAALAGAVGLVRRSARPIHSRGEAWQATLRHTGADAATASGVAWLDEAGEEEVLVRCSASAGLPGWLPDVQGIAVRVPQPDGHADLLMASTGTGRAGRFLLRPARARGGSPYTTLLPYRGPRGPLLLCLRENTPGRLELGWATPTGPWHPVGELVLRRRAEVDTRFDPVLAPLPGLDHYDWAVRLREPAYRTARG